LPKAAYDSLVSEDYPGQAEEAHRRALLERDRAIAVGGNRFWLVELTARGEVMNFWADRISCQGGALLASREDGTTGLVIASGEWKRCFAADVNDGMACTVTWQGSPEDAS